MKLNIKKFIIISITLIILIMGGLLVYKQVNIDKRPEVSSFLYEAKKGKQVIYIQGTIHASPNEYNMLNKKLRKTIDKVDYIYFEVNYNGRENKSYSYGDENINKHLSEEEINKLKSLLNKSLLNKSALDDENFENIKAEYLNMFLFSSICEDNNIEEGVEEAIYEYIKDKNIDILGLETDEFRAKAISLLSGDYSTTRYIINNYEEYSKKSINDFNKTFDNYLKNNDELLQEFYTLYSLKDPNVYKIISTERNINFVENILKFDNDKKYLVAIGYGHLFGPDNVLELLKAEGYTIEKLQ